MSAVEKEQAGTMKLLVVDDEPTQCRSLSMGLRGEGFYVFQALSAQEAVKLMDSQDVDVAIVDVMMPVVSGLELCRLIKDSHPHVKVILISAYHLTERQVALSGSGAVAFMPKPYKLDRLVSFLNDGIAGSCSSQPGII